MFAALQTGQSIENITLEEALDLFKLPMNIGTLENEIVTVAVGRFGPYIKHGNKFVSIPKSENPLEITIERATELILEKRVADQNKEIKTFEEEGIYILNGRYGPYISHKKKNFKIPKSVDPASLTLEMCKEIIEKEVAKKSPKKK
jgi:DNA topoisomerase-1